jgi:hypothetical protein
MPLQPPEKQPETKKMLIIPPETVKLVKPAAIDTAATTITALSVPQPATPQVYGGMVKPAATALEAKEVWETVQEIKRNVLTPEDFRDYHGKKAIVKSGWRKFAAIFNLSDEIVEETRQDLGKALDKTLGEGFQREFQWKIKVKVTAPNGRFTIAVGHCSTLERFDVTRRKFGHPENDVYGTAHTRAKNRAISDLVGGGEVTAEELE